MWYDLNLSFEGNQAALPSSFEDFLPPVPNVAGLSICRILRGHDFDFDPVCRAAAHLGHRK